MKVRADSTEQDSHMTDEAIRAGQVNYYHIRFDVSSANGPANNSSGTCYTFWGDNQYLSKNAYSENVPVDEWISCDGSDFSFKLFPYFSIGNFSLAVQQSFINAS